MSFMERLFEIIRVCMYAAPWGRDQEVQARLQSDVERLEQDIATGLAREQALAGSIDSLQACGPPPSSPKHPPQHLVVWSLEL
jgi:hypothetical protein